ncbi:hypothetical protein ETAA8_60340 [Anatilimnocola aggregata]|uniref:Uncharacterized protein n=1 Tax=Anatilimnocola aggregata TaxID=2528021 RepID=A0A517YKX2_9BACT|nr:hypothetical protein [Anatilimnocola aggregata]QDU30885.1 hypothetical protein ETAA8_60340 [Anatilimnocola aggregata]
MAFGFVKHRPMLRGAQYWGVLFTLAATIAGGAEPSLRAISVRGLQIGGTTELICDGDDFSTEPRLLLPFAAEQIIKPGNTDKRATISVTLGDDVQPGYYQLRMATAGGLSLPVVIGVDRLPQLVTAARIEQLPAALHGSLAGSTIAETRFVGKKGDAVAVEIEAQRIGSKLRPVIHLATAAGRQLTWSWPQSTLFGDTRLEAILPEDGEYRVTWHDLEYGGGNPGFYRVKIGQWSRVDQVFPPVIKAGEAQSVELLTAGAGVVKQTAGPTTEPIAQLAWPTIGQQQTVFSGPRPFVRISPQRELIEEAAKGEQSLPDGSLGISGRLLQPQEEDRYSLTVTPGDKLKLEVTAQRTGSPVDIGLIVRNSQGAVLTQAEDSPGSLDPVLEYTVPDKVTSLVVCVIDSQGRGGPLAAYHLQLSTATEQTSTSNFHLATNVERTAIPRNGRWVFPLWVDRRGTTGPIEITAHGLPPGVTLPTTVIPAESDGTLVTLSADGSEVSAEQQATITRWQGTAGDRKRTVVVRNHPLEVLQPWLAEEIALARASASADAFTIDWREFPESAVLQPTVKLPLPIKLTRNEDKTAVRLSLLTSQSVTLVNKQPDPRSTLRVERAVELGAKLNDGDLTLLVPAELAGHAYDLAVQAELLSADKQKVLATAFTPVRRLPVQLPIEVQLASGPVMEVKLELQKGGTHKIDGKIKRSAGSSGDVVVSIAGLPAGVRAAPITLKADATDFVLEVVFPAAQPVGELAGLSLSATITPDPKQANVRVKSRDVELKLQVVR